MLLILGAATPIAVALVLLVGLRWPAVRAMPVCAVVTAGVAIGGWQMPLPRVAAAVVEGVWVTLTILLIVFGALFFLAFLRATGAIGVLQRTFARLSPDARIQAVLVAWLLGSFLEGAAGFGTPAAITAPLLIGLGFPPLLAVVVALVGDSTAVSFGSVGTPIVIGLGQGLGPAEAAPPILEVAMRVATLDLLLCTLMPLLLVAVLTVSAEGRRGLRLAVAAAPFAVLVGGTQAVTSRLVVGPLGPELPSLLGPIAGMVVALLAVRRGFLQPREPWRIPPPEDEAFTSSAPLAKPADPAGEGPASLPSAASAFSPYALLLALLILTRIRELPLQSWLASVSLESGPLFGTEIVGRLQPLYSPGAVFIVTATLAALWLPRGLAGLSAATSEAGRVTAKTAVALVAAIVTVRVFIHSGGNPAGLEAMPLVLAEGLAGAFGPAWPLAAPWVGALGSFIAGSATFSNMLFALLQLDVAVELGFSPVSILALQTIGASAGNMVCIHNVVAACAIAGILGREGAVIRRTAVPMIAYVIVAGLLGALTGGG